MIAGIAVMMAAYIITKMIELACETKHVAAAIASAITIAIAALVAVVGVFGTHDLWQYL